jgi:hypothetical protein
MAESPPAVREKTFDFPERSVVTPLGYESAVACSSDSAACFLVTPAVPRTIRGRRQSRYQSNPTMLAWWPQETTLVAELAAVANEVRK